MDKEDNLVIKEIARFDKNVLLDLNNLLLQWSQKNRYQIKPDYFKSLIKNSHLIAMYDGEKIIGTITLIEIYKLSGIKGSLEHLLIDEKYRGKGLGKKLMLYAIGLAKKLKMDVLFLTCEPKRTVANLLYQKLGFKIKETNFYYLDIKK